jgi:hypothetical protein
MRIVMLPLDLFLTSVLATLDTLTLRKTADPKYTTINSRPTCL